MVRKILGTFAGIVVAMLVVGAMDYLSRAVAPAPSGEDFAAVPTTAKLIMASGWFLAVLIGGFLAVRIARWVASGWIVTGLILAACLFNGFAIPGVPIWMQIAGFVAPLLAGFIVRAVAKPA